VNELPPTPRPPIRRENADKYLFILLISFAISVSFTRLFLNLTGFPKIGGGELHFAHVLWGGLILFLAVLILLIFANRSVFYISSAAAGIGMGLFIDEIGKFITSTNDYFYPPAAPVIYVFFLLIVLVYIQTKKPILKDTRSQLYEVFEDFKEVLDNDLSLQEKSDLNLRLENIILQSDQKDLTKLAETLRDFLNNPELFLVPEKPSRWMFYYSRFTEFINNFLTPKNVQAGLVGGLLAWSIWTLAMPTQFFITSGRTEHTLEAIFNLIDLRIIRGKFSMNLYFILLSLQAAIGAFIFIFSIIFPFKFSQSVLNLIYFLLLISLTILTPLMFYFDQFSSIINASLQFVLILFVLRSKNLLTEE